MPIETQYLAAVATDSKHGQGAAATNLLERFVGADVAVSKAQDRIKAALGLAQDDELAPLLGNDLVVARAKSRPLAAWVVKDEPALRAILSSQVTRHRLAKQPSSGGYERYARAGVAAVARKGPLIVVGDPVSVNEALATQAQGAGMTRRLFGERLRGLPADSLLRIEGNAALIPFAQRSKVPWVRSLNRFALTVRADASGLHARLRAATAPVSPDDVPLAPNAPPPAPLSRTNGATAGISDLRHVIRAGLRALKASDPGTYRRYDIARRGLKLLRRGDIDGDVIDQLGGTATLWSPDLMTFTLTARVADPGRMARALNGLKPLMGRLLAAAGLSGARYGVTGDTFVATTTPGPSLAQLAAGSPARIDSLTGAVTGVIRASVLRQTLIDRLGLPPIASLALGALGDATFSVRTATTGVDAGADVSIR
jgi:hypothetical protein